MARRSSGFAAWLVVAAVAAWPAVGAARPLFEFKVTRGDKVEGRYDMGVVRNEGGTFVVGNFYPGAQALKGKKRGSPSQRLYGELDADGRLGKYKRWVKHGGEQEYWMVFLFKDEVKLRHEAVEGGKGDVKVLGKVPGQAAGMVPGGSGGTGSDGPPDTGSAAVGADAPTRVLTGIAPLDPGLPALAWVLLGRQPFAHEISCAGASAGSWGKARVVSAGTRDFDGGDEGPVTLAHWKVEGDCGAFDLFLGDDGVPVRMQAGERTYERFVRK